jgi:hypothetical protein
LWSIDGEKVAGMLHGRRRRKIPSYRVNAIDVHPIDRVREEKKALAAICRGSGGFPAMAGGPGKLLANTRILFGVTQMNLVRVS